ncbi:MAG: hypothetical protein KJ043_00650 [Anaerolineae bacterium]|nr:hypothetical protein [Anaerolineae bacterium]
MELLRKLSLDQLIIGFIIVVVVIVIAVIATQNANQEVVIDYTITTPTPFIDYSSTPVTRPLSITEQP